MSTLEAGNGASGEILATTMVATQPVDFLIFAPLPEERAAILKRLPAAQRLPPDKKDILIYHEALLPVRLADGAEGSYRIIIVSPIGMARVAAATATTKAIERWAPLYVLVVGIAGGCSSSVGLGDVLVADQVVDYELQKVTAEGPEVRYVVHPTDARLRNAAQYLEEDAWRSPELSRPVDGVSRAHVGPVASGDKVVAVAALLDKHRDSWPKLIGIEMEAGGVSAAAFEAVSKPGILMIRGVSDLANSEKGSDHVKRWRGYACEIAAAYTVALLQSGPAPFSNALPASSLDSSTNTQPAGPAAASPPSEPEPLIDFGIERARHEAFFGRTDVLAEMDRVLQDPRLSRGWLLVTGGPGQGKSALVNRWLAGRESQGEKVPAHFLLRGVQGWDEPRTVLRSLCAQLTAQFPGHDKEASSPLEGRMLQLLTAISQHDLQPTQRRLILVVDGLDEAQAEHGGENPLPRFLPHALPPGVFVVCSSRPSYPNLEWLLGRSEPVRRIELDDSSWSASNEAACRSFWAHHAQQFAPPLESNLITAAITRSDGNFLYAVKLREWLLAQPNEQRILENIPRGLQGMLSQIWLQLLAQPEVSRRLALVGLAALCAARDALPLSALALINGWSHPEDSDTFLRATRSFLRAEPAVGGTSERYRPYHEAFREFVVTKLGDDAIQKAHRLITARLTAWPVESADPFVRRYTLQYAVTHRWEGSDWNELSALCRDVRFLTAKCCALGIASVEDDLKAAATRCTERILVQELVSLHRAVHEESHWLWLDPSALPTQLYNRLRCRGWSTQQLENRLRWDRLPMLRIRHPLQERADHSIRTFACHPGSVGVCAFTVDGLHVITGASDGVIHIWDAATGRELAALAAHSASVEELALSASGKRLVSAGRDGALIVWDLEARRELSRLQTTHGAFVGCELLCGDDRVVSVTESGAIEVWSLSKGTRDSCLERSGHRRWIWTMAVTPDGQRLVTGAFDDVMKVWDLEHLRELATLSGHSGGIRACRVTPDGRRLVSAAMDSTIRLWDLRTGQELRCLRGHTQWVTALAIHPDGRRALSGGTDDVLKLWDLETGECLATFSGHASCITACAISKDGKQAISGSADGGVKLWDLGIQPQGTAHTGHNGRVLCCAISPDGQRLLSGDVDGKLWLWDLSTGTQLQEIPGHSKAVLDCQFSPGGRLAASASADTSLRVWNVKEAKPCGVLRGHTKFVRRCLFDITGENLISSSEDNTLRVWSMSSGEQLFRMRVLHGMPLAWSGDHTLLFSGGRGHSITIWDWEHHQPLSILQGHTSSIWSLACTPDGRALISTAADHTVRVWDLASGSALGSLQKHTDMIAGCALLEQGRWLITASDDKTLNVWCLRTGACVHTLYGNTSFSSIAAHGNLVCVGDEAGAVWQLEFTPPEVGLEGPISLIPERPTSVPGEVRALLRKEHERVAAAAAAANAALLQRLTLSEGAGQSEEVISLSSELVQTELSDEQKLQLCERLWKAAEELLAKQAKTALQGFDLLIEVAEQLPVPPELRIAEAMSRRFRALSSLEQHDDAYRVPESVATRFRYSTDLEVQRLVASSLLLQARLAVIRELDAPRIILDLLDRFGDSKDAELHQSVLLGLHMIKDVFEKDELWEELFAVCSLILSKFRDVNTLQSAVPAVLFSSGVALHHLNRPEEALQAFDAVLAEFDPESPDARQLFATAALNRARVLDELGRAEEARAGRASLDARFGGSDDPILASKAAAAQLREALQLLKKQEMLQALPILEQLNERLASAKDPLLTDLAVQALYNTGVAHRALGHEKSAMTIFRAVADRFRDDTENLRFFNAQSLFDLGELFTNRNRPQKAIRTYDELIHRYKDCSEKELREHVQAALLNKTRLLERVGSTNEVLSVVEQSLQHSQTGLDELHLDTTAKLLFTKALKLAEKRDYPAALKTCDELLVRFSADTSPLVLEAIARTLVHKGHVLSLSGQHEAAHATYDEVVRRFGTAAEVELQERVVRALMNQAGGQLAQGRYQEALAPLDQALQRSMGHTRVKIVAMAAQCRINKAEALRSLERPTEALALYDDVTRMYGDHADAEVVEHVAAALYNKADLLIQKNKPKEAILELYSITERLRSTTDQRLRRLARMAQQRLDTLLVG